MPKRRFEMNLVRYVLRIAMSVFLSRLSLNGTTNRDLLDLLPSAPTRKESTMTIQAPARNAIPQICEEAWLRFRGKWVAILFENSAVIASGDDALEATQQARQAGYGPAAYILDYISMEEIDVELVPNDLMPKQVPTVVVQ